MPASRLSLPLSNGDDSETNVPLYDGDMTTDLHIVSRNRLAETITGGLSITTKMPCPSWGISATRCRVGSLLAQQPHTVCSACYALKGRYRFESVQAKLEERYRGLLHQLWTPAMVFLIRYYCDRYFRFFDSGDLQNLPHLKNICTIAENVPEVQIWLPTREAATVRQLDRDVPPNLAIRVSANRIDARSPRGFALTSTVISEAGVADPASFPCPSHRQSGKCEECRACWDAEMKQVTYRLH
jgi:hypothetical protein